MPPYRFRLAAVQRVRESRRDDARLRLADGVQALEKLAEEEQRVRLELDGVRRSRATEAASSRPDTNRMLAAQRYEAVLERQITDLIGKQQLVDEEINRRRDVLAAADRDVRVLELLDERGRERHRREEMAAEQMRLDEIAVNAWGRRSVSEPPTSTNG